MSIALGFLILGAVCQAVLCHGPEDLKESYDYIIAGGGTSGLVVANRLTENPKSTVPLMTVMISTDNTPQSLYL